MKVIMTIKDGNKAEHNLCRDIEMSPQEYDFLKEVCRNINQKTGEECITAYVYQI